MSYKQNIKEIEDRTLNIGKTPDYKDVFEMYKLADSEVDELFSLVQELRGTIGLYKNNTINSESEVDRLLERVDNKINRYILNTY